MTEKNRAISDLGESQIMPSVTVRIPMPPGASIPAQPAQTTPAQAPADSPNSRK
ncbi:MAG: hypothetical protein WBC78_11635 [Candidatus Sulfotelmatobacter sp.]